MKKMYCRRLPLKGLFNVRDLGGFCARDGVTRFGVFLRSDVPAFLTPEDVSYLKSYGLKSVLDLRSPGECETVPDILRSDSQIAYINVPMYDRAAAQGAREVISDSKPFAWAEHYIRMVEENKGWMLEVLERLSEVSGCTLIHCATGKDRTGLVAMALLGLCGVSDEDIISDYSVSQIYLKPVYEKFISVGCQRTLDDPFFSTAPENMARLLEHINSVYGGVPSYLVSCGVTGKLSEKLLCRLIQRF